MRNPLRPVRLAVLWLLSGIPLENHTAAVQRIDAGHQQHLARLRRPTITYNTGGLISRDALADAAAATAAIAGRRGPQ